MATTTGITTTTQPAITAVNDQTFIPRGPVTAQMNFYVPPADGSKPFNWVETPPEGQPQRNYSDATHAVQVTDIRNDESSFTLNEHAFAALRSVPSAIPSEDFTSDDAGTAKIEKTYYPEVERLILEHVSGAKRVLVFDHTIRRPGPDSKRGPVQRTHIDQTPTAAATRAAPPPDEADELLAGRYRIINVWRPLNKGPVQSFPLAFAESSSVPDTDIVGVEHRYADRVGETAAVQFTTRDGQQSQKWYYWSGMTPDERLLLQCADSQGNRARVPHTAFVDPRTPEGAPGRESVEVRTLVFG